MYIIYIYNNNSNILYSDCSSAKWTRTVASLGIACCIEVRLPSKAFVLAHHSDKSHPLGVEKASENPQTRIDLTILDMQLNCEPSSTNIRFWLLSHRTTCLAIFETDPILSTTHYFDCSMPQSSITHVKYYKIKMTRGFPCKVSFFGTLSLSLSNLGLGAWECFPASLLGRGSWQKSVTMTSEHETRGQEGHNY